MISRYLEVDVEAAAGMVLAREVLDQRGAVLLPPGAALTEQMLGALLRRGIDRVLVANPTVDEAQLAVERERVERRLAQLFRRSGAARADATLRERLHAYRLETLR
jgi:hypothetical protein